MTYPASSPVSVGQATEADQYNFLRNDALCLGNDPASSGTLRDLLCGGMGEVSLSRASKTSVRLSASEELPCALMIGGRIFTVRSDQTVSLSAEQFPDPGRLYLYAVGRADGSFAFTAGDTAVPGTGRCIGTLLWSGSGVIPGTVQDLPEREISQKQMDPFAAQGRLSLVPGEPVSDNDITMADTVYYVPYQGSGIGLYLGGSWESFRFPELSLSLSGMQRGIPYDIFVYADEDGLHLSALSWGTSGERPAGMITRVDGIRVSAGDSGRRYLGSIVLNASGYGEDSRTGRLVWNENHRLPRPVVSRLMTAKSQGSVHMNSWAPYYDEDAPAVRLLVPFSDTGFFLEGVGISTPISESDRGYQRAAAVGICRDMATESPYTGNENCAHVFTHSFGNSPMTVRVQNLDSGFHGCHSYTLAFWSNYNFSPAGTGLSAASGECPGIFGTIYA